MLNNNFLLKNSVSGWDITKVNPIKSASWNYGDTISPKCIRFSPNGLVLYTLDDTYDRMYMFSLSIAWDITSTMTFINRISTSGANGTYSGGFDISSDGTKLFLISRTSPSVTVANLTTAWDVINWSSYSTISITGVTSNLQYISFTSDGLNAYLCTTSKVYQCKLTTPFNLSTATLFKTLTFSGGSFIKPDGTHFYKVNSSTYLVEDYILTTPNDISTIVLYATSPTTLAYYGIGVSFSPDGKYMYEVEPSVNMKIYSKKLV